MTTIRDIAKTTGVSVSTVSLALSQPQRVSPETRKRILAAAEAAGYVVDPVARSLASGKSRLIGMVVAEISNPFYGNLLKGVERRATAAGYLVIISDSAGDPARESDILDHLSAQRVAGILVSPCSEGRDYAARFDRLKMPVVMVDHKVPEAPRDFVGTDNRLASAILTEHLLQFGHRRIGFIAGVPGQFTTRERIAGFVATMEGAGVEVDPSLIVHGDYEGEAGYFAAMRLLTRPDRPTAIIGSNNVMALATLQAINDLGLKCPDRMSLAGIDDVPWSGVISPRLTAVVQDATRLGEIAINRLLARISEAGAAEPFSDTILPPRFVVGQSSARLATAGAA